MNNAKKEYLENDEEVEHYDRSNDSLITPDLRKRNPKSLI